MNLQMATRRAGMALTMVGAAAALLAVSASPAQASGHGIRPIEPPQSVHASALFTEFTGGARGSTADSAIFSAIDDAKNSAAASGLYTCSVVGQPQVFEVFNHPYYGHTFFAEATVSCTP